MADRRARIFTCGMPTSFAAIRTACALHQLHRVRGGVIEVVGERHRRTQRGAFRVHERLDLPVLDQWEVDGIPTVGIDRSLIEASAGTGIGPDKLHYVLGITKAYCTRVGSGPFPSELCIETETSPGHQMFTVGKEFGTVTGRKRRCGWFDAAALRRSARINGVTGLCITKLDVLDGLQELNICTGYKLDGEFIDLLPIGADEVARCEPVYETMPGWKETTFGVKRWEDLPANARAYLDRLEALCEVPIAIVSTGPERDETILKQHPFK